MRRTYRRMRLRTCRLLRSCSDPMLITAEAGLPYGLSKALAYVTGVSDSDIEVIVAASIQLRAAMASTVVKVAITIALHHMIDTVCDSLVESLIADADGADKLYDHGVRIRSLIDHFR